MNMNMKRFFESLCLVALSVPMVGAQTQSVPATLGMRVASLRYPEVGIPQKGLVPVVVSGKIGFIDYNGEQVLPPTYDREKEIDTYRFQDTVMKVKKNGKYGYLNTKLQEVIPCKFDEIGRFDEGMAPVKDGGMWGFADTKGNMAIPAGYKRAVGFSNGLAAVVGDNDSIGFIDKFGILTISCQFDNQSDPYFSMDGRCALKKDGRLIHIDRTGAVIDTITEPEVKAADDLMASEDAGELKPLHNPLKQYSLAETPYDDAWPFVDGYSIVMKKINNQKKYGIVSIKGKEVVPCSFDQISGPFRGPVSYFIIKGATGYGAYDVEGKEILPCEYQSIGKEGSLYITVEKDGKKGFVDATGKLVIPCQFDDVRPFNSEAGTAVEMQKKDKMVWNFIDKTGKVIASPEYDDALTFVNGVCPVQKKGKWGFVNESLKEFSSLKYEYTFSDWKEHWSYAHSDKGDLIPVSKEGKFGFIDMKGKEIIKPQYDEASSFRNGMARVKMNGERFFIDKTGKKLDNQTPDFKRRMRQLSVEVPVVTKEKNGLKALVLESDDAQNAIETPYIFDDFGANYIDGVAPVKMVGKWGLINTKGEIVVPCIYDGMEISEQGTAIVRVRSKKGFISGDGNSLLPYSDTPEQAKWITLDNQILRK